MSTLKTKDDAQIFYKDWGPKDAQPIVFHHGWPLSADDWDVFDSFRKALAGNRAQFFLDVPSGPFYGFNRPGAQVSAGIIRNCWRQGMMGSALAHYEGIKAFSETDQADDLKAITAPTLVMQGDDDQIVPYKEASLLQAELLKQGTLKIYPGFPHGMMTTNASLINADLLAFIRS